MQVPKIEKITLNIGIGDAKNNKKALQSALEELILITGQKPVVTNAKKDISNFKVSKRLHARHISLLRISHSLSRDDVRGIRPHFFIRSISFCRIFKSISS